MFLLLKSPSSNAYWWFSSLGFLPMPRLDSTREHYKPFDEVYGPLPDERDWPSNHSSDEGKEIDKANRKMLSLSGKVRSVIMCRECFKPRCAYSETSLKREEKQKITELEKITPVEAFCFLLHHPITHPSSQKLTSCVKISLNLNTIALLWWSFRPFVHTAEHWGCIGQGRSCAWSQAAKAGCSTYMRSDGLEPHTWGAIIVRCFH